MINKNSILFSAYCALLLVTAPFNLASFDTYYYWDWSRHLDLSYYDGSPMIAYLIKLSTLLFGNTLFSLTLVGICVTAATSWIIYRTARQFISIKASYIAMFLWLFSPLVTVDLLQQTTYDTPLCLFWALSVYYVVRYIKTQETRILYCISLSIGLMLLSKYSGIVLVLSLFIFLISTQYRNLFKSFHFYLAVLLAILCFSPVIIWNYQHEWQSFLYQLTVHQHTKDIHPLSSMAYAFFGTLLPLLNFMLVPSLLCKMHITAVTPSRFLQNTKHQIVTLCWVISATFFFFYLLTAAKAELRGGWLTPYLITAALLGGYCYQYLHYRKSAIGLIAVYAVISVLIVLNNGYQHTLIPAKKKIYYRLMQQVNNQLTDIPDKVFTSGWFEARMLFFLKNKPLIYTLDCGSLQNQYALWSENINKQITHKTEREILYIDLINRSQCLSNYFDKCVQLTVQTITTPKDVYSVYAYRCVNDAPLNHHS
ncbi:glycosyltransferase family 39 protein [Legionella worsleiensis]|uniref:Glycosyl transferase n=1 Tax=Legionella worsleiensis TaxID=45076 RepID=A0A0W1AES6_9GAMM|nr:glycosyltransferase family 39 protein [Legionella worsleiensis]KTD79845.1 glycosyl transferase [Legionella worsleiensis]STY32356.1 glycosyl transferase [Legionella worsleiensis]